jgi:FemAB-related protein (PEP-CTERM system-associated)
VRARPDSHFGQLAAWRELVAGTYGCRPLYLLAEEGERLCGILPLFERRGREPALFSAPGGLLADDETVAAALLETAREALAARRLQYLELRDQRRAWSGLETTQEHVTMVLELAADTEVQWKAFDAKLRNQIRKAQRMGFEARWGPEQLPLFHRVMLENMRDLGTPIRGLPYYQRTLEALGTAAGVLILLLEGEPAGTMFAVAHRDTMTAPWASSLRRFFAWCPNQMLYWEALQRAIALGLGRFDFGRSQWHSSTYRFKEQWGATPVPLYYQYVLGRAKRIPTLEAQKGGYALAVALWRRLPLPLARWLGERAKRLFPEVL